MIRHLGIVTAVLAALVVSACGEMADPDYVAVIGAGEARQFPDEAAFELVVAGEGASTAAATEAVNRIVATLLEIAANYDVKPADTETLDFEVDEITRMVRHPDGTRTEEPAGFHAEQRIRFTLADVARTGELYGRLIAAGGRAEDAPRFCLHDPAALFEKARALAIADARRRARAYAEATGRRLGRVMIIEESGLAAQRLNFDLQDRFSRDFSSPSLRRNASGLEEITVTARRRSDVFVPPQDIVRNVSIYAKFALAD